MTMSSNNTSDEYWAEKLRRENCDQFNTLVRMHLSFVLDLNTDETDNVADRPKFKKWSFVPFVKKSKGVNRGVMDGAPLTQEGICQVYQLIEYLGKEPNICAEGIFRRTGSLARQQELRALLNQGQSLNLDGGRYSVHDCASVLKGFLAELPEPLLTDAHYPAHCQIAELCCSGTSSTPQPNTETRLLRSLQLLLLLLPTENRVLLKDVLELLNETAKQEPSNKMSADSLATLFTPHLLCPRKLSPEALHADSQSLSGIVAFMIRRGVTLFEIPPKLAVDIKLYFTTMNEKSPKPATNTVYSFVDRERTARAHASDPTETALAQLYAYIQGLPESSKKRKLVKQFNRQNGNGTPLQLHGSALRSKSLGDSIKRHIFFNKTIKRGDQVSRLRSSSEEVLSSPNCVPLGAARTKLFCVDCETTDESDNECDDDANKLRLLPDDDDDEGDGEDNEAVEKASSADETSDVCEPLRRTTRCYSEPDLSSDGAERCWTSTPAVLPLTKQFSRDVTFTPLSHHGRKSMSPITRSTQKMSRAMQETMMTPRSRKPVLLMSGTNVCALPKLELMKQSDSTSSLLEEPAEEELSSISQSRSLLGESPIDASFSSRTDDYGYSCNSIDASSFCENDENVSPSSLVESINRSNKRPSTPSTCDSQAAKRHTVDKEPVLKPKQYNSDGEPVVFETSF